MVSRDAQILEKVLREIKFLKSETDKIDFDTFSSDERLRRSVAMTLINIGELANKFTKDFRVANAHIPIQDIIGLRNHAAHGYHSLKFRDIWNTIKHEIPILETDIKKILTGI